MHNFALVSRLLQMSYCFLWSEYDARRGALEIISITKKWFDNYLPTQVKRLILWSDNCTAQNKNWMYFFFMAWLVKTGK